MIGPVLIANRGEIAVRIARTVHSLGLHSIAVFTDPDAGAVHVEACDMAADVAGYLDIPSLIAAARATGARAVHPGYGFLSENPAFARAVTDAGLVWVGPPPGAIELMGDKGAAKRAAAEAGVPVVPAGDDGGYPVIVKALAGGGGKGMRVVRSAAELEDATAAARREAKAAFGDDRVLVERYLERPRHIEVQVLADSHGACLHFGERECSLQRRHQKVVEEAPSPVVDAAMRAQMGAKAVALARACGYVGAGTVEFIAPADGSEFFFLEMNTRLQVEHPVTELVYGVDLVEQQLRVAAGEALALRQEEVVPRGHAVEARLYAEDPGSGFLPATGTVRRYRPPRGEGVRVDAGIREGDAVGTEFDPLLAKVIAHGDERELALRRLGRALGELELLGVANNAAFTRALIERDDVRSGEQDTGLLERVLDELDFEPPDDLLPAAALAAAGTASPPGPWRREYAGDYDRAVRIADGRVTVGPARASRSSGEHDAPAERTWSAAVRRSEDGAFQIALDGIARRYAVTFDNDDAVWIGRDGHQLELRTRKHDKAESALADSLEAPMPGKVLMVEVENGDKVEEGEVLLVLESMKMELSIRAPHAGTVAGLELGEGDRVARGQALLTVAA